MTSQPKLKTESDTYRGWAITFEYGYFNAIGPNYDASWEGEEDGWVDNGEHVTARTREGLIEEIDAWLDERPPTEPCLNCGAKAGIECVDDRCAFRDERRRTCESLRD